jgi:predicted acetylornithine/succinylornithine family transaminase
VSIPAPAASSFLVQNYGRNDIRFVRGEGCWLVDDRGNRHLDAFAGVAVSTLGHGHPGLAATIAKQAATLIHVSNHYQVPEQERLAAAVVPHAFNGRMLFCNSGTEANEAAYKAVRAWGNLVHEGRKTRLISFLGGFHGRTMGSLSLTANPKYREPFAPMPGTVEFLPYGDVAAVQAAMGDDVAGVFVEPIQGEGGVIVPPTGFFAALRTLCDKHDALLVVDEVQTGIARTGKAFGYQHEGITPDIISLAKGLGGGVPIGAALFGPKAWDLLKPGMHGTTYGGNPLACAAALTVVSHALTPEFIARVAERGEQLMAGLRSVTAGRAIAVRGRGLLIGVQFANDPAPLIAACREQGLIVGPSGNNTVRFAPPLIISASEVDEVVARFGKALATWQ